MDLMTPETGTIVWTSVIFVLLMLVLYKVAWKPILHMLEERERRITTSLKAAEEAQQQVEKSAEKQQQIISDAKKEAATILANARQEAEKMSNAMLDKSRHEAEKLLERAKSEIESSREKALNELRQLAVEISMNATEKLIRTRLSKQEHEAAIKEALSSMENDFS